MRAPVAVLVMAVVSAVAAPVPKVKARPTEERLLGRWRMVASEAHPTPRNYELFVTFTEKGELELRYEFSGGRVQVFAGTYKVVGGDRIDYAVTVNGRKTTEVLSIDKLTDTRVTWTDRDKKAEELERVEDW